MYPWTCCCSVLPSVWWRTRKRHCPLSRPTVPTMGGRSLSYVPWPRCLLARRIKGIAVFVAFFPRRSETSRQSPSRADSAEGRRPSTGPEKRSAPRAGQRLRGASRQPRAAASAESEGPFLPIVRRERGCVSWGAVCFTPSPALCSATALLSSDGVDQASEPPSHGSFPQAWGALA